MIFLFYFNSLTQALMSNNLTTVGTKADEVTDGIDIKQWTVRPVGESENIVFSIWDFAGQSVYYNTHQVRD